MEENKKLGTYVFKSIYLLFVGILEATEYCGEVTDEECGYFRAATALMHMVFWEFTQYLIKVLHVKVENAEKYLTCVFVLKSLENVWLL